MSGRGTIKPLLFLLLAFSMWSDVLSSNEGVKWRLIPLPVLPFPHGRNDKNTVSSKNNKIASLQQESKGDESIE